MRMRGYPTGKKEAPVPGALWRFPAEYQSNRTVYRRSVPQADPGFLKGYSQFSQRRPRFSERGSGLFRLAETRPFLRRLQESFASEEPDVLGPLFPRAEGGSWKAAGQCRAGAYSRFRRSEQAPASPTAAQSRRDKKQAFPKKKQCGSPSFPAF